MTVQSEKFLSVAAIKEGTVIDHIPAGEALKVVEILGLSMHKLQVSIGMNFPSKRDGFKDIIKVENRFLTAEEASIVAILAPKATLSLIHNFEVTSKISLEVPESIEGIYKCPNARCISNAEKVQTKFFVKEKKPMIVLQCHYCLKHFCGREIKRGQ